MRELGQISSTGLGREAQSILARRTSLSSLSPSSPTPLQSQVDTLVGGFTAQATDWRALAAMTVGGTAYRAARVGVAGLGSGSAVRAASIGLGLAAEVSAFEFTHRGLSSVSVGAQGRALLHANLWSWNGPGGIRQGLLHSLIAFGALKGAGHLARGENIFVQHLLQDTGMVAGHHISGALNLTPRPTGSLAEQFLHAEGTNLQIGAGMALSYRMAPGLHALERGLDLSLRVSDRGTPSPRPQIGFHPERQPAFSGIPKGSFAGERNLEREPAERISSLWMAKGSGEGGQGSNPCSLLLGQVGRFRDPKSIRIALRLLYVGMTGPLRDPILDTLLAIESGQPAAPLLRSLAKDPRTQETQFLSRDVHARTVAKISELKHGSPKESGTFYFDPKAPSPSIPTLPEHKRNIPVTGDELHRLNTLRLLELERLLEQPETEPLPFSIREALAEGVQVAQYFERVVRAYKKLADIDPLTGFFSRGGLQRFVPSMEHRLVASRRYSENHKLPDYVLMLDIDHFKRVNDQYGHPNGDEVIREVAQMIRRTVRLRDVKARYGGEEFFILLAKAGQAGALETAERIRKAVEEELIEIEGFDPIHVTVSIGAAEMRLIPSPEKEGEWTKDGALADAIQRADDALYEAKNSGRNRVHLSSE